MRTIHCNIHNNNIFIFKLKEQFLFTKDIDATVIFYDSRTKKYLKKYTINKCDENCQTIKELLHI